MLSTIAFGDLGTGLWGAVWDLDGARFALLGAGADAEAASVEARIEGSGSEGSWRISGDAIELEASPDGEPGDVDGGFDQLIRVRGRWSAGGSEQPVDCFGRRGARDAIDPTRFESIRDVSAWFEPDLGMAVVAARPRGSAGHGEDLVTACVLEEGHSSAVAEPRLSTTYASSGAPARASLELWLERTAEEEEPQGEEDEPVRRFPRRAAGEALGPRGNASDGGLVASAELFRWHARGREGAGVYVLVTLASA